ncbi:zinc-dependent metalloproteinase lipoprotein, BF0631 family [Prevotella sp. KH2C16]|nr:zinc-dependent metalloproteinase lipoprotein, BF0631 family [Prevotella sp. KH2C16]
MCLAVLALFLASCSEGDAPSGSPKVAVDEDEDKTTAVIDESYTYKLPVIFHVLYQDASDESQYIPQERLRQILANVNDLYAGNVYASQWDSESEDIRVRFVLAEYDERGRKLPVPGVEYVKWNGTYPIDPYDFMGNHKDYVRYIWEPNEYINVMMYHFAGDDDSQSETLGITHMPYAIEDDDIEGLTKIGTDKAGITKSNLGFAYCASINSKYAWKDAGGNYYESDRYTNADHRMFRQAQSTELIAKDMNVTLAHELGHYLGLHHTFAEREEDGGYEMTDDCADTDYCGDTPSYVRKGYVDGVHQYMNSVSSEEPLKVSVLMARTGCDGKEFQSANFMDYFFTLGFKFSAEQKARMRHVLYYSPLIPGPKKERTRATRTLKGSVKGIVELPIRIVK